MAVDQVRLGSRLRDAEAKTSFLSNGIIDYGRPQRQIHAADTSWWNGQKAREKAVDSTGEIGGVPDPCIRTLLPMNQAAPGSAAMPRVPDIKTRPMEFGPTDAQLADAARDAASAYLRWQQQGERRPEAAPELENGFQNAWAELQVLNLLAVQHQYAHAAPPPPPPPDAHPIRLDPPPDPPRPSAETFDPEPLARGPPDAFALPPLEESLRLPPPPALPQGAPHTSPDVFSDLTSPLSLLESQHEGDIDRYLSGYRPPTAVRFVQDLLTDPVSFDLDPPTHAYSPLASSPPSGMTEPLEVRDTAGDLESWALGLRMTDGASADAVSHSELPAVTTTHEALTAGAWTDPLLPL